MKKFLISLIIAGLVYTTAFADTNFFGIGTLLIRDIYNRKVFVRKVVPNSPAAKYGLPEGAEIISVDDKKVKKRSMNQVTNMIRGQEGTTVKLLIKNNNVKQVYEIPRGKVHIADNTNDRFEILWAQIIPDKNAILDPIPHNMSVNMSEEYYNQLVPFVNYWAERKEQFKKGYNACMTYSEKSQESCLTELTKRELDKTAKDNEQELQKNMIRQQAAQINRSLKSQW